MLRAHGHFLDDYRHAPIKIVNHLSRQLGLPPVLFLDRPGRAQTERAQSLRIRRHLGIRDLIVTSPPICATGCAQVPWRAEPPPN